MSGDLPSGDGHLLPPDVGWTEDKVLIADLSQTNAEVARYVLRLLDVDAGQAKPTSAADEQDFGERLIELGERVQGRAERRVAQSGSDSSSGLVVEGGTPQPPALEPSPDMDTGP